MRFDTPIPWGDAQTNVESVGGATTMIAASTHPQHNDPRIPPVRAAPATPHPGFTGEQEDGHDSAVRNETAPLSTKTLLARDAGTEEGGKTHHNVVREALAQVSPATVPPERDRSEEHLHPAEDGVRFSDDTVQPDRPRTQRLFVYVKLEVYAESELQR